MLISIITINRNNASGLQKTMESVLGQSYKQIEYIIIDGASTDESCAIVQPYISRLHYFCSEPDSGVYQAMNKGIAQATGEYMLFLNSGDCLKSATIIEEVVSLKKQEAIIYGDLEQDDQRINYPDTLSFYYLRYGSMPHPCSFFRKELFNTYGMYNEQNKIASDWEFYLKTIVVYGVSYAHIPMVISVQETPGLSAETNLEEGYRILYSLFPKMVIEDFERIRNRDQEVDIAFNQWLKSKPLFYKFLRNLRKLFS